MSNKRAIGKIVLGLTGLALFLRRQRLECRVKAVYLANVITSNIIPLGVIVDLVNSTINVVLVRSISGVIRCNGMVVGTFDQMVNKRIESYKRAEQIIMVDLNRQESLQALFDGYDSGNLNNLAFEFDGNVVIGEKNPVSIKIDKYFTWGDVQKML